MIRRHPIRGLIGGLLIGLGLSILLVIYGAAPLGSWTVIVIILLFAVIGTAAAWLLPARSSRRWSPAHQRRWTSIATASEEARRPRPGPSER